METNLSLSLVYTGDTCMHVLALPLVSGVKSVDLRYESDKLCRTIKKAPCEQLAKVPLVIGRY
ncbi:MAG: hypothetical protein JNL11_12100 [Bdellovibrionaceae bacterium]|nr:hypothetical protein [Pseudobdellovibrionaceae bacterium]